MQEEGKAAIAAKVLNVMIQVTREPQEVIEEATEAKGKRDIDPAQGRQRQEEEAGKLRHYTIKEQYEACREEAAHLRQRIQQREGITDAMEAVTKVRPQVSAAQQRAAERKLKENLLGRQVTPINDKRNMMIRVHNTCVSANA